MSWLQIQSYSAPWKCGVVAGICGATLGFTMLKFLKQKSQEHEIDPESLKKWTLVGRIKKLVIYPVKSCPGIEVETAIVTSLGLAHETSEFFRDRIFLIIDSNGGFKTLRQYPTLALIRIKVSTEGLEFSAPNSTPFLLRNEFLKNGKLKLRPCRIFTTRMKSVTDCGDEIGSWFDTFLNASGLRLVYHHSPVTQRTNEIDSIATPHFTPKDFGSFQDETSYMIMTEESIKRLNEELERPLKEDSFRGSILLEETKEPFAEEGWTFVRIGHKNEGPILKTATPCFRCRVTTVDPATGEFHPTGEPLKSALKLKRSFENEKISKMAKTAPVLGVHFGLFHGDGKVIKVGDPIYAALR